jgi:phage repressor protein C with HTH and peptisase S24 domain
MSTSTLQDRVKLALQISGKSKTDLWKGCGVRSGTVTSWVKGPNQTISGVNLMNAAKILGVNPEWLATGRGDMDAGSPINSIEPPLLSINTSKQDHPLSIDGIKLNAQWAEKVLPKNSSPNNLRITPVSDNAMLPTLKLGDALLVDCGINSYTEDGIYIIESKAGRFIKRIHKNLDGSLTIKSDNPAHPQETFSNIQDSGLNIIGKALFSWLEKTLN